MLTKSVNVMDIETFLDENNSAIPYCVCCKFDDIDLVFWYNDAKNILISFFEKICSMSKEKKIEIYTHNINFDGFVIINYLKKTNIYFDCFVRDTNLYWIKIFYLKREIVLRCSYKIIPLSIEEMGTLVNLKKGKFPHKFANLSNLDYVGVVPDRDYFSSEEDYVSAKKLKVFNFRKLASAYCAQDVRIAHAVLIEIINIINFYDKKVIKLSYSFASISYKIYIKNFNNFKVNFDENNSFERNYCASAYYGGRCEVFGNPQNKEIVHYFDFKGMYSQCMLQNFPTGKGVLREKNLDFKKIGFHTIKFKCDDPLPFLPYKSTKLFFANGIFTGTYWHEEILNAIKFKKCEILDHYSSYEFENEEPIFEKYVKEFTSLRLENKYCRVFAKNMINGLYGSFALKEEDFFTILILNEIEFNSLLELVDVLRWKKFDNLYIVDVLKNKKSLFYFNKSKSPEPRRNISYAAIIAAKARIKLNNALEKTLEHGGKLYYADTDSIFAGFEKSYLNLSMGEITWEEIYEDAVFIGTKFYQIKGKNLKVRGVDFKNYSFDDLKEKFYNDELFIVFDKQLNIQKKKYDIYFNYLNKTANLALYEKRIFSVDKKSTTPLMFK